MGLLLLLVALVGPVSSVVLRRRSAQAQRRGDEAESIRLGQLSLYVRIGWIALLITGILVVVAVGVLRR